MSQTTSPILREIEMNVSRLLGAALTLMAQTPFFARQSLPPISVAEFLEALSGLEGRNESIILDASLGDDALQTIRHNAARITQLRVLWRVVRHLSQSEELLREGERMPVIRLLGPSADAVFLLGTRILSFLLEVEPENSKKPILENFTWELLMVDGALQAAQTQLRSTKQLNSESRRYARATLWSLQVARDALLIVGSQ